MNIKVTGKNIEITKAIRDYVNEKADRLEKFEGSNTELNVVCKVEREEQIVEMQLSHNGEFIKIEEKNDDLYASIDLALDRLERQMRKSKEKVADKNKNAEFKDKVQSKQTSDDANRKNEVTNTIMYEIKPIALEDAKLKLSGSDNLFLPFVNIDTKDVNILYKRNDGSFGIVVPE